MQPLGQLALDHQPAPGRRVGNQLLLDEVDLFVESAASVVYGAVCPRVHPVERLIVGPVVELDQIFPQRDFRYFERRGAVGVVFRRVHHAETRQHGRDLLDYLRVVRIVARDDVDPFVFVEFLGHPLSESRQRRGDRRHGECDALQRRIAPRFVIRCEHRHVHAAQQLVVMLVENAVVAVQVRRDEDQLHGTGGVLQPGVLDPADDRVPLGSRQIVRQVADYRRIDRRAGVFQMRLKILARAEVAGRNGHVSQYGPRQRGRFGEFQQRVDEHVESLVLEFVPAAGADDQRLRVVMDAETDFGYFDHLFARGGPLGVELGLRPDEIVLETVRRDQIDLLAEQVLALFGRQIADRREAVVVRCGRLFERVLRDYAEPAGQVVGVQLGHVAVQGHAVAGYAATHDRRVRREDRRDIRRMLLQVQTSARSHPLVEVGGHPVGRLTEEVDIAFDYLARRRAEQHGLDVVPLPADRVDPVRFPQKLQHVVLAREKLAEIDQNRDRASLDFPVSDLYADIVVREKRLPPVFQQLGIFFEFQIDVLAVDIGTDQYVAVAQLLGDRERLGCDDGVYSADFVAHFPADLEQVVRRHFDFVTSFLHLTAF